MPRGPERARTVAAPDDSIAGARASRRTGPAAICLVGALAVILVAGAPARMPLLVWNASPSSPRGLYGLVSGSPNLGDTVVAWPPAPAARFAAARGYLPPGIPLVKTLAAGPGDRVCAKGGAVWFAGRSFVMRQRTDRSGRELPQWEGCRALGSGEVLLLGLADPASFDGRYFGPTPASLIVGRARLLWRA